MVFSNTAAHNARAAAKRNDADAVLLRECHDPADLISASRHENSFWQNLVRPLKQPFILSGITAMGIDKAFLLAPEHCNLWQLFLNRFQKIVGIFFHCILLTLL